MPSTKKNLNNSIDFLEEKLHEHTAAYMAKHIGGYRATRLWHVYCCVMRRAYAPLTWLINS